jgi:tetratricopeptide (TPR) repeat protein
LGLCLIAVTVVAYQPAWHAGFIWDDDAYVTHNKLLSAPDGLKRIWFSLDSPSQYFPLTYTTFRIERALWGLNPAGYHWTNILIHAVNALLVWQLLKRLNVPGHWLAAAIFALHPVQVESVAWITERKNVLSLFFFLLALLVWLEFIESRSKRPWLFYGFALIFYLLALFSKTVACTLPAALLLVLWLKKQPINRTRLLQIVPFVALGLGMGLLTIWWERHHQGTQGTHFMLSWPERLIVASHALWFYAGKLVWPVNLTFSYPRWTINSTNPLAYGWLAATAGLGAAIYFLRRFTGRSVEVGTVFYVAVLSPLLGFVMLYTFRYSFVADHYQYAASIGLIALVAAGITTVLKRSEKGSRFFRPVFCGALLTTLGFLTWQQCRMYSDIETLWRTTLARNPNCWMAHSNLGSLLLEHGQIPDAVTHFRRALELQRDDKVALNNLGKILFQDGRTDEAIAFFRKSLADDPEYTVAHNNLGLALLQKGETDEAITHLRRVAKAVPESADVHNILGTALLQKGEAKEAIVQYQLALNIQSTAETHANLGSALFQEHRLDEAILHFEQALEINPKDNAVENNLGTILFQKGRTEEAIVHFRKALEYDPNYATGHYSLAAALLSSGKPDEAITHFQKAAQLQPDNADAHFGLANALWQKGALNEAIEQYQKTIELRPDHADACYRLANAAWILATSSDSSVRDGAKAFILADKADRFFGGRNPQITRVLAAAYAENRRFIEAIQTGQRALQLAIAQTNSFLIDALQTEIQSYRSNTPLSRITVPAAPQPGH